MRSKDRGDYVHEHTAACFKTYWSSQQFSAGAGMRMPSANRKQVRQRIVQSAVKLFNRHGYTAVSIDDVMAGAGLTRGGFYSYFQSKSELYAEAISGFVEEKLRTSDPAESAPDRAAQIVRDYLSRRHFEEVEASCPLIGLPNDLSRSDQSIRLAQEFSAQDDDWRVREGHGADQLAGTAACARTNFALCGRDGACTLNRGPLTCG